MSALLSLALLFIFGVLQVSSGKKDTIVAVVSTEQESKCMQRNSELLEAIPGVISLLKEMQPYRQQDIESSKAALAAIEKCVCGKEAEDKKCQEEVDKSISNLSKVIKEFYVEFVEGYLLALDNTIDLLSASLTEIPCCCPKAQLCIKKYNYAAKKTAEKKECKSKKCNMALVKLSEILPDYITTIESSYEVADRLIKSMEEVQKLEKELVKDEKCKDEKNASLVGQMLRQIKFDLMILRIQETTMTWTFETRILAGAEASIKERESCGMGKEA